MGYTTVLFQLVKRHLIPLATLYLFTLYAVNSVKHCSMYHPSWSRSLSFKR